MEIRTFLVPTAASLSLAATTACGPAVVGEWDLSSITYDGQTYDYPYTYSGTYDGQAVEVTFSGLLTVDKDLTGAFTTTYTYTVGEGTPEVYTYSYDLTATKISGKEYTIVVDSDTEGETFLDLNCTIDKSDMTCTSNGEGPDSVAFTKATAN